VATPPPAPPRRRRGPARVIAFSCLGLLLLVVVSGVGVFVALQTHAITSAKLLNLVGQGPAVIEVDNFRDDQITVGIDTVSSSSGSGGSSTSSPSSGGFSLSGESLTLNAFDVKDNHAQNPGKYQLSFRDKAGADLGSCTLDIHGGDHYQFVALPTGIAVNRANNPSSRGADFVIQSSKLCGH
jgi:hypothetical protein